MPLRLEEEVVMPRLGSIKLFFKLKSYILPRQEISPIVPSKDLLVHMKKQNDVFIWNIKWTYSPQ